MRSPRAIAYALDAPHLGEIPSSDLETPESRAVLGQLADRLTLLGRANGAWKIFLVPVLDQDDVLATLVARRLLPSTGETAHRMDTAVLDGRWVEPGPHPTAVLFTRRRVRARNLKRTTDLLDSLGWPILGFVTCDPRRDLPRPGHAGAARRRVEADVRAAHVHHATPAAVAQRASATAPAPSSNVESNGSVPPAKSNGTVPPAESNGTVSPAESNGTVPPEETTRIRTGIRP